MRATFQPVGGGAGRSQANGPATRRWLAWPPPQPLTPAVRASTATTRPARARIRLIGSDPPVAVVRAAVVVGILVTTVVLRDAVGRRRRLPRSRRRFRSGWSGRAGGLLPGPAGAPRRDAAEPPPALDGWVAIRFPAGETANQLPPNAVRASPFVSPTS